MVDEAEEEDETSVGAVDVDEGDTVAEELQYPRPLTTD